MKGITARCISALLGVFALAGMAGAANVEDIVRETQRLSTEGGKLSLVWWVPVDFWEASMKANGAVPDQVRVQVTSVMGDYTIIALMRAVPGPSGLQDIQPKEELLKNTQVEIGGKVVEPLPPDQISPAAQLLLAQLKPALASAAGAVGQGMEFVIYPGKTEGKPLLNAAMPGALKITFYGKVQQWRLPLGSLLPPKTDSKTGEQFPGNYEYNPFTGGKLGGK
jgi:hypothetical protein